MPAGSGSSKLGSVCWSSSWQNVDGWSCGAPNTPLWKITYQEKSSIFCLNYLKKTVDDNSFGWVLMDYLWFHKISSHCLSSPLENEERHNAALQNLFCLWELRNIFVDVAKKENSIFQAQISQISSSISAMGLIFFNTIVTISLKKKRKKKVQKKYEISMIAFQTP